MGQATKFLLTDETGQDIAESLSLMATGAIGSTLAPAFSDSQTYEVGDYVIKDKTLYRCIVAVETAGPWDSTDWINETVADALESTKATVAAMDARIGNKVVITADDTTPPTDTSVLWVYPG